MTGSVPAMKGKSFGRLGSVFRWLIERRDRLLRQVPSTRQFNHRKDQFVSQAEDELTQWFDANDSLVQAAKFGNGVRLALCAYRKEQATANFWRNVICGDWCDC